MFRFFCLFFVALAFVLLRDCAATATASYYASGIPTDVPLPGDYSGHLRPRAHYSPPVGFMNDPNGLHRDASGIWHMYYQYDPLVLVAGNQHWAHATSSDLYTWTNQKIALWPPNNYTYVFSGSAVIDANNTSGFFPEQTNGVVAIYTLAEYPGGVQGKQAQAIAYSRDGGYTFSAYAGNPVLDLNSTNFRDPYVFWHGLSTRWVMVVAFAADYAIGIYTSPDLTAWTHASNFSGYGYLGSQFECPNLVQMPVQGRTDPVWFLQVSVNPGAPLGGSASQYFVGDFNGTHFAPSDAITRFTDFAKDNYAAQFFTNLPADQQQVSLGWASNWQYSQLVPTGDIAHGSWRSAMTVPRATSLVHSALRGYQLVSFPYALPSLLNTSFARAPHFGNGTLRSSFPSAAVYLEANLTGLALSSSSSSTPTANFTLSSSRSGEFLRGGISPFSSPAIWFDRSASSRLFADNPYFTNDFSAEDTLFEGDTWSLSMLLDGSVFEIFLNRGRAAGTATLFPESEMDTLCFEVQGLPDGAGASVEVWSLKDGWKREGNASAVLG